MPEIAADRRFAQGRIRNHSFGEGSIALLPQASKQAKAKLNGSRKILDIATGLNR
jgi:hypothetical protein